MRGEIYLFCFFGQPLLELLHLVQPRLEVLELRSELRHQRLDLVHLRGEVLQLGRRAEAGKDLGQGRVERGELEEKREKKIYQYLGQHTDSFQRI